MGVPKVLIVSIIVANDTAASLLEFLKIQAIPFMKSLRGWVLRSVCHTHDFMSYLLMVSPSQH